MSKPSTEKKGIRSFPGLFWLVILFEFFERGSYYGMMSFLSVYFVDVLHFPKENVGVIKGVIQPLLYFLPILSGAVADRFGYRRVLMVAFALLGGGYFLTSQASAYGAVFAALVVMGFGAGLFKPIISGTIAKITDEENSTLGFGIYYWSINLGAFLFPLFLVPFLKAMDPRYVIIASAIGTSIMLIPTALFFKDPVRREQAQKRQKTNLIQTMANAFEIIYSPVVLLYHQMKKSAFRSIAIGLLLAAGTAYAVYGYINRSPSEAKFPDFGIRQGETTLLFGVERNMLGSQNFSISQNEVGTTRLTLNKPGLLDKFASDLLPQLQALAGFENTTAEEIGIWIAKSDSKISISFVENRSNSADYSIALGNGAYIVTLRSAADYPSYRNNLLAALHEIPDLAPLSPKECDNLVAGVEGRSFFPLFLALIILLALAVIAATFGKKKDSQGKISMIPILLLGGLIWFIPGLTILGRIIATVLTITVASLIIIDKSEPAKFKDHAKFLLMIVLYSGFWILYFQMFDSVLWYVQAYVDASSLNQAVNGFLSRLGIQSQWFFDVEHVTVINAGTIILLQLVISAIVRKTKALPTMMAGIALGTLGMAILAINTNIWVFIVGISIFSIGEMTAHPKFISYIGLIAPSDRKAMYMGYLFLYGVFGSSIGGVVGAKLYVHFVDTLNQPRTLWLIFSCIGVFTIVALYLYNRFVKPQSAKK